MGLTNPYYALLDTYISNINKLFQDAYFYLLWFKKSL